MYQEGKLGVIKLTSFKKRTDFRISKPRVVFEQKTVRKQFCRWRNYSSWFSLCVGSSTSY